MSRVGFITAALVLWFGCGPSDARAWSDALELSWSGNFLTISGSEVPGGSVSIHYLEAFCRDGSTARPWHFTVIPHSTRLIEAAPDRSRLVLESQVEDGVVVRHTITAEADSIDFQVTARNPTARTSMVHWAQPCMRVDKFVGVATEHDSEAYLGRSFVFDRSPSTGEPVRKFLAEWKPWARAARYTPGQVWPGPGVSRNDVNPRPLNPRTTANGLIGCISADGRKLLAMAWDPYQELFQGVVVCLHSDFRIGGLKPGETREIRGKIYLLDNDPAKLLKRYEHDFPNRTR